jgi:hypothetical protein
MNLMMRMRVMQQQNPHMSQQEIQMRVLSGKGRHNSTAYSASTNFGPGFGGSQTMDVFSNGQGMFPTLDHNNMLIEGDNRGSLQPHAMMNHQMTSKKSFRIRGDREQDILRKQNNAQSNKDLNDFNNDILKSVYELRQSHNAFV